MDIEICDPKRDDEGRRMLNVVRSELQRMGVLMDDLLACARVGRQELRYQPIDMTALEQDVIEKLELTSEHQKAIDVQSLPHAHGDRNLIRQVWVHLLSNAVKFTSQQPAPVIGGDASFAGGLCTYCIKGNDARFDSRLAHKLFGVF